MNEGGNTNFTNVDGFPQKTTSAEYNKMAKNFLTAQKTNFFEYK